MERVKILGCMSGTSLDGLDLCLVSFHRNPSQEIGYEILEAKCVAYTDPWKKKLKNAHTLSAVNLVALDHAYGSYIGEQANIFLQEKNLDADYISSHGHTVFHKPSEHISMQIGHGAYIAAQSQLPVICDFRTGDIALQGQGAPLVPMGDALLFGTYDACLNLGGFANISYSEEGKRMAYDICPVNIVINSLMADLGKDMDEDGKVASAHSIDKEILERLNSLSFYAQNPPKSLGREWVEDYIYPILDESLPKEILVATFTDHAAQQIRKSLQDKGIRSVLITGGGAYNKYLIEKLSFKGLDIAVADKKLIEFKEALIFALLGFLRLEAQATTLPSVTGANASLSSGAIYLAPSEKQNDKLPFNRKVALF